MIWKDFRSKEGSTSSKYEVLLLIKVERVWKISWSKDNMYVLLFLIMHFLSPRLF